jgi:ATP-binding cassette subfamily B protein
MLTFVMYTFAFLDPTRRLAVDVIDGFESAQASARRVVSLLRSDDRDRDDAVGGRGGDAGAAGAPPEDAADAASTADASASPVTAGRVEYDGVTFAYPGSEEPTLDGVSLTVEPGETVGIVGPSGAGKSTLSKLLLRFYATDAGTVRVDGRDVAEVDPRRLREAVGYVSQEPLLFHGTVAENVAYASPDASREEIEAAVRAAGAHGFVTDLPDGYDTGVGERGASLSGGQRQRLAIARALVGDPPILLLDEATSHVDNATELAIRERLAGTAGDRTTFAIAHRLSTVRDADRIVVLEDGRVVERGRHDELVDRDGTYAALYERQVDG